MRTHRFALVALLAGAAVLAACDKARQAGATSAAQTCTGCHGGTDNTTGAPPRALDGSTAVSARGVGSHTAHIKAGVACESCHRVPTRIEDASHIDGAVTITFSDLAKKGIPVDQQATMWNPAAGTCAVYCHGTGLGLGGTNLTPVWTAPPAGGLGCTACHAAPPAVPPHSPTMPLTACATCHSTTVQNVGGVPTIVKGGTHVNGQVDAAGGSCTDCHGDASRSELVALNQAAPPKDLAGLTASDKVGAHQAHLHDGPLAKAFACAECHTVPSAVPHSGGVQFATAAGTIAKNGGATPGYTPATLTCNAVYCHGATLSGGSNKTPAWNGGPSQAGIGQTDLVARCGVCHGFPPTIAPHTAALTAIAQCNACHPGTANADGTINVANHVNGTIEATGGAPHPVPYPSTQHGPAAKADLASCAACHGTTFDGGIGPSCTACHTTNGHPTWKTECTFCHGTATRAADTADGFPQVGNPTVYANLAGPPLAATTRPIGAHEAHYGNDPTTGNQLSRPIVCTQCHGTLPTDGNLAHVNKVVAISWGALPTGGGVTPTPAPVNGALPAAQEPNPNCANYCHGGSLEGGTKKATGVFWTGGSAEAACGTCHSTPPPYSAGSGWHVQNTDCNKCHPGYALPANGGLTAAAKLTHVDGQLQVNSLSCSGCHSFGAPFTATTGATASSDNRVGAHNKHLQPTIANAFSCTECHTIPSGTHPSGAVVIAWGATAAANGATPTPAAGTIPTASAVSCANYCHGQKLTGGSTTTPAWTGTLTGCGTCHGAPPGGSHQLGVHVGQNCTRCHNSVAGVSGGANVIANKALHVDRTVEVVADPALSMTFTKSGTTWTCANGCHGTGASQSSGSW
ncbi:MAG TPA: CxxxxCH/CxxCH domain-containing protein [Anaeromyxobacteraceae bacterium]|nr:CxxxxCH/CxxCH domain-containing protein [Anaeromyxobacteraceae bacterium]